MIWLGPQNDDNLGVDAAELIRQAIAQHAEAIVGLDWVPETMGPAFKAVVDAGSPWIIDNAGGLRTGSVPPTSSAVSRRQRSAVNKPRTCCASYWRLADVGSPSSSITHPVTRAMAVDDHVAVLIRGALAANLTRGEKCREESPSMAGGEALASLDTEVGSIISPLPVA